MYHPSSCLVEDHQEVGQVVANMTPIERVNRLCGDAVAQIHEVTIPPPKAADKIIDLCVQAVDASAGHDIEHDETTTPGLGNFLWGFWENVVLDIVLCKPEIHDRLLEIMRWMKKRGRTGFEEWKVWDTDMDWDELPMLGANVRESFNGPMLRGEEHFREAPQPTFQEVYRILSGDAPSNPDDPWSTACQGARTRWLTLCQFVMRLWVEDVADFDMYGIWMMREGLEDLDLDQPDDISESDRSMPLIFGLPMTRTLGIEEASICVQTAGARMHRSSTVYGPNGCADWDEKHRGAPGRGGKRWTGVDGYHRERWKLWRDVFQDIIDAEGTPGVRAKAVESAKAALASMERAEV